MGVVEEVKHLQIAIGSCPRPLRVGHYSDPHVLRVRFEAARGQLTPSFWPPRREPTVRQHDPAVTKVAVLFLISNNCVSTLIFAVFRFNNTNHSFWPKLA